MSFCLAISEFQVCEGRTHLEFLFSGGGLVAFLNSILPLPIWFSAASPMIIFAGQTLTASTLIFAARRPAMSQAY
jgi:hypothetical protein